jgi:hypothetical protein
MMMSKSSQFKGGVSMGLFEFMFPEQAQAEHLRAMREMQQDKQWQHKREQRSEMASTHTLKIRIDDLEKDLGFAVLVLASLLSTLDEKSVLKREDVEKELRKLDLIDGKEDCKISTAILKHYFRKRD